MWGEVRRKDDVVEKATEGWRAFIEYHSESTLRDSEALQERSKGRRLGWHDGDGLWLVSATLCKQVCASRSCRPSPPCMSQSALHRHGRIRSACVALTDACALCENSRSMFKDAPDPARTPQTASRTSVPGWPLCPKGCASSTRR